MNSITVTVPMEAAALSRAADMFTGLANDVNNGSASAERDEYLDAAEYGETYAPALKQQETSPAETQAGPTDTKDVIFDPAYCGEAQDPFYGTGKRAGQWKKKRGVSDAEYDNWYAEQLGAGAPKQTAEEQAPVNTRGAFSPQQEQAPAVAAPRTAGEFMAWVSEKQAAGLLTQEHIQGAYVTAGLNIQDLFPPNDEPTVAARIGELYRNLASVAGA